ncbi:ABC transporter permease [Sedimentibacter sp. zth1]|uniref:ABC transporter permease n=1 Tax=Sedimentibacter sp. zth1 TaxID=2816908 RepID=UPI001A92788E|nr:ABC transporter permease [Sedimentibacter sp. zth1]QSX04876.1 ABC transporter permease [Sedimentibacter sp. zth1]
MKKTSKDKNMLDKVSNSYYKSKKLRNIFAIIGIVLTTILFTSLITLGTSMKSSMQDVTLRQIGTSAHICIDNISEEQFEQIKNQKIIKEYGYSIPLALASNEELKTYECEIRYMDEKNAEFGYVYPSIGKMPNMFNEIALDANALKCLGFNNPQIGQKINLSYYLGDKLVKDEFVLSGYWDMDVLAPTGQILVSREYLDKKLVNYKRNDENDLVGRYCLDIKFNNTRNFEKKLFNLESQSKLDFSKIKTKINYAYLNDDSNITFEVILGIILAGSCIAFCGYLIIFNVFYISIYNDIKYYGLLKTIGTTSKQIKKIVRKQAYRISIIGITIGLILGYIVGVYLTPIVMKSFDVSVCKISINPLIFIVSALFSFFTVMISVKKPLKIASQASPMEALTLADIDVVKPTRKSGKNKLYRLSISNVFRNKGRAFLVIVSLSLSLVILNCTYVITNSFDIDKYVNENLVCDYLIYDANSFNIQTENKDKITRDSIDAVLLQEGIKDSSSIRFVDYETPYDIELKNNINKFFESDKIDETLEKDLTSIIEYNKNINTQVYGIENSQLSKINIVNGCIDLDKWNSGNYIIIEPFLFDSTLHYYNIGDKITIKNKEFEVMAIGNIDGNISSRYSNSLSINVYMSQNHFNNIFDESNYLYLLLNVEEGYKQDMERYLENYCKNINPNYSYQSRETFKAEVMSVKNAFLGVGAILTIIIATIGLANLVNTVITSLISRRHELALLQCIGMTKKQVCKMLIGEGVCYFISTCLMTMTIGLGLIYFIVKIACNMLWFLTLKITILPILIVVPIMLILSISVSVIGYKIISKQTIIECLKVD